MVTRRNDLETRLVATDDASKVIDKVADDLDALDKRGDVEVGITADDKASGDIDRVEDRLRSLSGEDRRIVLSAQVTDAERDIARILKSLARVDEMDDEEVRIRVDALDNARVKLDRLQGQMREVDGETVDVKVEASGVDEISDKLGALPGILGELGGAGGVGGVAALATGLFAAATSAKDMALEAKTTADLMGSTVEEASKLQSLWGRTGADVNDLNDVLLQMNGVLATTPELAKELGINLADGRNITQRFVEMTDKLAAGQLTAQQASQLFGEEGVRQVGKLRTLFGGLSDDLEDMPAPIDDDDVAQALEMDRAVGDLVAKLKTATNIVSSDLIPVFTDAAEIANTITDALPGGNQQAADILGFVRDWSTGFGVAAKQLERVNAVLNPTAEITAHLADDFALVAPAADDAADAVDDVATAVRDVKTETDRYRDSALVALGIEQDRATAALEHAEALRGQLSAMETLADRNIAAAEAQDEFTRAATESALIQMDSKRTTEEKAEAVDRERDAAIDAAKAERDRGQAEAEAQGKTYSAQAGVESMTTSLLNQARYATPAARHELYEYALDLNGITGEKKTEILALVDQGLLAEADQQIADVSEARETAIAVDADTTEAQKKIDSLERRIRGLQNMAFRFGAGGGNVQGGGINPDTLTVPAAAGLGAAPAVEGFGLYPAWPTVVTPAAQAAPVNVRVEAGIIADHYGLTRVVRRAVTDGVRLAGSRT